MSEVLTVSPPAQPYTYEVVELYLNWRTKRIEITLEGSDGARPVFIYDGDVAKALMTILNTANLSVSSLQKRILTKLNNDGLIVGPITGVPI